MTLADTFKGIEEIVQEQFNKRIALNDFNFIILTQKELDHLWKCIEEWFEVKNPKEQQNQCKTFRQMAQLIHEQIKGEE